MIPECTELFSSELYCIHGQLNTVQAPFSLVWHSFSLKIGADGSDIDLWKIHA